MTFAWSALCHAVITTLQVRKLLRSGGITGAAMNPVVRHSSCYASRHRSMARGQRRVSSMVRIIGVVSALTVAGCVSAPPTSSPPAPPAAVAPHKSGVRSRLVSTALQYLGAPYARGGASPAGFDCSGFVKFVYARAGVALPHGAAQQYRLGSAVSRDELMAGDIVFFDSLRHSGIYIGDARFVHATKPGDVVTVSRLDEEWFRRRWVGARRVL